MTIRELEPMIKKLIKCETEIERLNHINYMCDSSFNPEMAIFCKNRIDILIKQRAAFHKELFRGTEIKKG